MLLIPFAKPWIKFLAWVFSSLITEFELKPLDAFLAIPSTVVVIVPVLSLNDSLIVVTNFLTASTITVILLLEDVTSESAIFFNLPTKLATPSPTLVNAVLILSLGNLSKLTSLKDAIPFIISPAAFATLALFS